VKAAKEKFFYCSALQKLVFVSKLARSFRSTLMDC